MKDTQQIGKVYGQVRIIKRLDSVKISGGSTAKYLAKCTFCGAEVEVHQRTLNRAPNRKCKECNG